MASLATIRAQIAADVATALGTGYQVSAYPLSAPTPPCAEVAQFGVTKHQAMQNGAEVWTCVVRAYVAIAVDVVSQQAADAFLDDDPVSAAIEADQTLDGNVSDLIVERADLRFWDHPSLQAPIVGVEWVIRILL